MRAELGNKENFNPGQQTRLSVAMLKAVSAAVLTTSRLAPLHLTPDLLERCIKGKRVAAIEVYADTMLENQQLLWKCPSSLREFACLPKDIPIVMAIRDYSDASLQNGDDYVSVENIGGIMKLSLSDYWRLGREWRVDAQISPIDHCKLPANTKRLKKSVDRTIKYHTPPAWVNVPGGDSLEMRLEAIDRMELSEVVCFSGMESKRWSDGWNEAVSQLIQKVRAKNSPIYFRGIFSLSEIKQLLNLGVDLFDTSLVDQLTSESKAMIGETIIHLGDDMHFADLTRLDDKCACLVCQDGVTRSYLHHLVRTEEMLASVYLQAHNLHQFLTLFEQ